MSSITLAKLNHSDRREFVDTVGWVFEGSPWVAERAWPRRPFATLDDLHTAMMDVVSAAGVDDQVALLRAHPDLGMKARISDASALEQSNAGLDGLTHGEFDRLRSLNAAYREKFGFPFLYAVKGSTKRDILDALELRLTKSRDAELTEAFGQVGRIARFRLEELIS